MLFGEGIIDCSGLGFPSFSMLVSGRGAGLGMLVLVRNLRALGGFTLFAGSIVG